MKRFGFLDRAVEYQMCIRDRNRAVHLDRGQTLQSLYNGLVGQIQRLVHGLALDQVGGHAAGGNVCAAAKGEELEDVYKRQAFTKARQNKKHLITSAFEHHAIMHSMAALELSLIHL